MNLLAKWSKWLYSQSYRLNSQRVWQPCIVSRILLISSFPRVLWYLPTMTLKQRLKGALIQPINASNVICWRLTSNAICWRLTSKVQLLMFKNGPQGQSHKIYISEDIYGHCPRRKLEFYHSLSEKCHNWWWVQYGITENFAVGTISRYMKFMESIVCCCMKFVVSHKNRIW